MVPERKKPGTERVSEVGSAGKEQLTRKERLLGSHEVNNSQSSLRAMAHLIPHHPE